MRAAAGIAGLVAAVTLAGCADGDEPPDDDDVTVATINVLHGLFCPNGTDGCRLEDRIDLLFQWIDDAGCPDFVTLQEVTAGVEELVRARADTACPFSYVVIYERFNAVDDAIVLSRYPPIAQRAQPLFQEFRHALIGRFSHPRGAVDVITTHLASGSDGATDPCGDDCPDACVAGGAATVRECQAIELAELARSREGAAVVLVTGDLNVRPGSAEYQQLFAGGGDVYLDAGNLECDPASGTGCTSGRTDDALVDIEARASNQTERIDYIWLAAAEPGGCDAVEPTGDGDGDGTATGGWADAPNPFAAGCGPTPDPPCWPSDHGGVQLDLGCGAP